MPELTWPKLIDALGLSPKAQDLTIIRQARSLLDALELPQLPLHELEVDRIQHLRDQAGRNLREAQAMENRVAQ